MDRTLFIVSDRTGITAESLAHTLMTQFEAVPEGRRVLPFVDTPEKVEAVVAQIDAAARSDARPPLVFASLVEPEQRARLRRCRGVVFDLFDAFLGPLSEALGEPPTHAAGLSHGMGGAERYDERLEAVNFALNYDDGVRLRDLEQADLILLGVSRCGKTPTSLYLALHYGVRPANYPLTEEDFEKGDLPGALTGCRRRLFGLTIRPERLHRIREARRPGSGYASLRRCREEVAQAEQLFRRYRIPSLDTTTTSVEEIATRIFHQTGLERRVR